MTAQQTAYINGRFETGHPSQPRATVLVVEDRRIAHIGSDPATVPSGAQLVDLGGDTVVPGFIDAHVHPKMGGLQLLGGSLAGAASVDEYWSALQRRLQSGAVDEWVVLTGYAAITMARSGADRRTVDLIAGQRPTVLINSDLHGGLANTAALRISGLLGGGDFSRDLVERDADGVATGYLNEEALSHLLAIVPAASDEMVLQALRAAQAHLHSLGIVGWQDALLGDQHGDGDVAPLYLALSDSGELTARVTGAIGWNREAGLEQIESIVRLRNSLKRDRFSAPAVKFLLDGVNEAGTAAMLHPYADATGHDHGLGPSLVDPELLSAAVVELDRLGIDVHMHAVGDRAVRTGLDAVAAARRANRASNARHQIAHAMFIADDDVSRFRELDVTLNMQLVWSAVDFLDFDSYRAMVGPDVMRTLYRFEALDAAGCRWSAGSDWPVSSPAPLDALAAGSRRALVGEGPVGDSWQRLPASRWLEAYTSGSAYSSRLDGNGVLRAGMNADFVRLDGDPLAGDPASVSVVETVIGGESVYRAS